MRIEYKMWLEMGGQMVFGLGLYRLLCLVDQTGSLHKAAGTLHMSYRAAWGKVRECEQKMGIVVLEKGRSGRTGNHLTPAGKDLIMKYEALIQRVDAALADAPIHDLVVEIKQDIIAEQVHPEGPKQP